MSMKVNGPMISAMDKVPIHVLMDQYMLDKCKKINVMGMEKKLGQIKKFMKEITNLVLKMDKVFSSHLMVQSIQENSKMILCMDKENKPGIMVDAMKVAGI